MKIDKDSVPTTIVQAVDCLIASLTEDEVQNIKSDLDYSECHHSAGRFIRNNWSLWEKDTPLVKDAIKTYGIAHADDISGLIFEWAFAKVRGVDFDPSLLVEEYRKHWKEFGTTPLGAAGVE